MIQDQEEEGLADWAGDMGRFGQETKPSRGKKTMRGGHGKR